MNHEKRSEAPPLEIRPLSEKDSSLAIESVHCFGAARGCGNLVGIQTYMSVNDYASETQYKNKLAGYMAQAAAEGWLQPDSIVIFPENIGTWLIALNAHESIFQAETLDQAMKSMIRRTLPRFLSTLFKTKGKNRPVDALFRMNAEKMALVYQMTFSHLASRYGVTIVAGSIFLPEPAISGGRLQPGSGPLQNISCTFDGDGRLLPYLTRKNTPVHEETSFLKPGTLADLPVFDTPAGRLGVLICADAWYPASYAALAAQGVEIIAVPNNQGDWHKPWPGYSAGDVPENVQHHDIGALTEREAWLKYALPGRISQSGASAGMQVFFHGRLWDQVSEGQTIMVNEASLYVAPEVEKAAMVNLYL